MLPPRSWVLTIISITPPLNRCGFHLIPMSFHSPVGVLPGQSPFPVQPTPCPLFDNFKNICLACSPTDKCIIKMRRGGGWSHKFFNYHLDVPLRQLSAEDTLDTLHEKIMSESYDQDPIQGRWKLSVSDSLRIIIQGGSRISKVYFNPRALVFFRISVFYFFLSFECFFCIFCCSFFLMSCYLPDS